MVGEIQLQKPGKDFWHVFTITIGVACKVCCRAHDIRHGIVGPDVRACTPDVLKSAQGGPAILSKPALMSHS
eukprot:15432287-Alexandrium_andersonii.AAC.1